MSQTRTVPSRAAETSSLPSLLKARALIGLPLNNDGEPIRATAWAGSRLPSASARLISWARSDPQKITSSRQPLMTSLQLLRLRWDRHGNLIHDLAHH